jgi:hypothetical protein
MIPSSGAARRIMSDEILIIRGRDGYRVLHGHLRLTSVLSMREKAIVELVGEGSAPSSRPVPDIWLAMSCHVCPC